MVHIYQMHLSQALHAPYKCFKHTETHTQTQTHGVTYPIPFSTVLVVLTTPNNRVHTTRKPDFSYFCLRPCCTYQPSTHRMPVLGQRLDDNSQTVRWDLSSRRIARCMPDEPRDLCIRYLQQLERACICEDSNKRYIIVNQGLDSTREWPDRY